ncbi:hypothetical protein DV515_00011755 [Chloebia gouldiae]|uniref:Uncharacterized protein n=1 Tax=Chloebia gouldiae TaxID=44316 RepID=A0A3L8S6K6_CHLGU|nr:hypothetical protein DV515_00011755 [Chloebia gouldiae]
MDSAGEGAAQPPSRAKVTVTVYKDLVLQHYGFEICPGLPLTIASVTAGAASRGPRGVGDELLAGAAVSGVPVWAASPEHSLGACGMRRARTVPVPQPGASVSSPRALRLGSLAARLHRAESCSELFLLFPLKCRGRI